MTPAEGSDAPVGSGGPIVRPSDGRALIIKGARIVSADKVIYGHAIVAVNGVIQAIIREDGLTDYMRANKLLPIVGRPDGDARRGTHHSPDAGAPSTEIVDAGGLYASPGFVDLHAHGGGGFGLMGSGPDEVGAMARAHLRHGTTSIVPTTVAAPLAALRRASEAVDAAMKVSPSILGIHFEGPYLSKAQCGAQSPGDIASPDPAQYGPLLESTANLIMMGAAPEVTGGMALGRAIRARGAVASISHSDAYYDELLEAIHNGYTDVTHLYSGCSGLRRINGYRYLGVVEGALLDDRLNVSIIADGKHLPPELLSYIYKVKRPDHICLMTDATRFAACEPGSAALGAVHMDIGSVGEGGPILEDGVMKMADRQAFAGSVATMDLLVRNMVRYTGATICDAVRMASYNPARLIRRGHVIGSLEPGMDADIVLFDEDVRVERVYKKKITSKEKKCIK